MKTQFSIVTRGGISIIVFQKIKGIQPSMSRKGNSPDNGMMESFFGILKSEMFYGYGKMFKSLKQFLVKEHITKHGNPYARKILFKFIHKASASHTNPCHIADFYEKRKRQSQVISTKPHTIASIHRLIKIMYYLITHNRLYDYTSTQNR